ncbi:hypothetical protein LYSHEL_22250 [Lysobacter helvus]|uniref:Uncharacterized protein n=2 Tax=Lysobacteraceae TaxID=32033 RepID=A0ABM7Q731_9GAMM|nr:MULTISPECIES: hypothetical protein [Lysobacter]BCT93202.1 hypothetical protein LYSCAS_22260 [Lysobacter caseinilyticus]BCT96354.1 hypothetical protein LYSHEL_22250 [Lysobacter helvus]
MKLAVLVFALLSGVAQAQVAAPATAAASAGVDEAARPKVTSQSWSIKVERSAKADGKLTFRLWRNDTAPMDVSIDVKQGQTDRAIALALKNAFRDVLDSQDFHVEVAANYVQLRALRGERRFGIELAAPVMGVDIELIRR